MNPSPLRVIAVGNVDDGKSTLLGRLLYDSSVLLDDQIEGLKRDNFNLAFLTDGLKAERERGITIDVAYRYFSTAKRRFVLIDAPGHPEFTRNMVSGASHADIGLIVIDVLRGVQAQTRRHAYLLSLLRIPNIIVCINKMDLSNYDEKAFRHRETEFLEVTKHLNFQNLAFIPVSSLHGENIVQKGSSQSFQSSKMKWDTNPTLMELLESIQSQSEEKAGVFSEFRLPVQGQLSSTQLVTGMVMRGGIKVSDQIQLYRASDGSCQPVKVNAIHQFPASLGSCVLKDSVALDLGSEINAKRGDWLFQGKPKFGTDLSGELVWFSEKPLSASSDQSWIIRHGTHEQACKILELTTRVQIESYESQMAPAQLMANDIGKVKIRLEKPVPYDSYQDSSLTGSAIIIDPKSKDTVAALLIN